MHQKKIESLKTKIISCFRSCKLERGDIVLRSLFFTLVEAAKEAIKGKETWIDEDQIIFLIHDSISKLIQETSLDERVKAEKATDLLSDDVIEKASNIIVEYIQSIPRNYYFFFKLPQLKSSPYSLTKLTDDISIVRVSGAISLENFIKEKKSKEALGLSNKKFGVSSGTYIRIRVQGYVDHQLDSNTVSTAISKLKQFIYLCILKGNVELSTNMSIWSFSDSATGEYIDLQDSLQEVVKLKLPESIVNLLSKLKLKEEFINKAESILEGHNKSTLAGPDASPTLGGLAALLGNREISPLLSKNEIFIVTSDDVNENTNSFKNALEWAFDSMINHHDYTMSFIQISVALEAILGIEANRGNGLTFQLADRCAYFIGKNNSDRKRIRNEFNKFYTVRSTLIHGSQRKITKKDREWLEWGRNTLNQILKKELFFSKFEEQ